MLMKPSFFMICIAQSMEPLYLAPPPEVIMPVQRTALGRAISMRVRMAEMELKRRGMGVGRSGEESRADLDESNRGQTFLADD